MTTLWRKKKNQSDPRNFHSALVLNWWNKARCVSVCLQAEIASAARVPALEIISKIKKNNWKFKRMREGIGKSLAVIRSCAKRQIKGYSQAPGSETWNADFFSCYIGLPRFVCRIVKKYFWMHHVLSAFPCWSLCWSLQIFLGFTSIS